MMTEKGKLMIIASSAALLGAGAAALALSASAPVNTTDRAAIEKIVREYILTHPEILPEAMENLRGKEMAKVIEANRSALETPIGDAWEGAADADVVLVEFFDYACGYCRASLEDIDRLLAEDKKLKVVYRDMHLLGSSAQSTSRFMAMAAQRPRSLTRPGGASVWRHPR
jgi:protein-disulfide isomerase